MVFFAETNCQRTMRGGTLRRRKISFFETFRGFASPWLKKQWNREKPSRAGQATVPGGKSRWQAHGAVEDYNFSLALIDLKYYQEQSLYSRKWP